jgi:hypothetical protein
MGKVVKFAHNQIATLRNYLKTSLAQKAKYGNEKVMYGNIAINDISMRKIISGINVSDRFNRHVPYGGMIRKDGELDVFGYFQQDDKKANAVFGFCDETGLKKYFDNSVAGVFVAQSYANGFNSYFDENIEGTDTNGYRYGPKFKDLEGVPIVKIFSKNSESGKPKQFVMVDHIHDYTEKNPRIGKSKTSFRLERSFYTLSGICVGSETHKLQKKGVIGKWKINK